MIEPVLTPAARRHIGQLRRAIREDAGRLERRFSTELRRLGFEAEARRALLAVTPTAACRMPRRSTFLAQVHASGRCLARLNVSPSKAGIALDAFSKLLDEACRGSFAPAREQLQLATILTLNAAYYSVCQNEAQTRFGLARAVAESDGTADLLRRLVRVLTLAFQARRGRIVVARLARPTYTERRDGCAWRYPLVHGLAVQLEFPARCRWLPREEALLGAAAERCAEAVERARLQGENQRLEALARRAEEEERRRIVS